MALFDDNKDNKEKGNNISKRIEKDIKKKKNYKKAGRGKTKNTKINHEKKETIKKDDEIDDKKMDIDPK